MCVCEREREYVANEALDKTTPPLQVRVNIEWVCEFKTKQVQSNNYYIPAIAHFGYTSFEIICWKYNFKRSIYIEYAIISV